MTHTLWIAAGLFAITVMFFWVLAYRIDHALAKRYIDDNAEQSLDEHADETVSKRERPLATFYGSRVVNGLS